MHQRKELTYVLDMKHVRHASCVEVGLSDCRTQAIPGLSPGVHLHKVFAMWMTGSYFRNTECNTRVRS